MPKAKQGIGVEGIVAKRDNMPYIKLFKDGSPIAQMSMNEARNVAHDILTMCARTEADAMIHRFFAARGLDRVAGAELMFDFRQFRANLDQEPIETYFETPSGDPPPN